MLKQAIIALVAGLVLAAPLPAGQTVHIDYASLDVSYNAITGVLSVVDNPGSSAFAKILDGGGTAVDSADIYNAAITPPPTFDVDLSATVVNPAGFDNISLTGGTLLGTDTLTLLASPSIAADAVNTAFGADADGITYAGGVLTIHGKLSTILGNASILLNPAAPLAWTYKGEDDTLTGPGSDTVADQITVTNPSRDEYDAGTLYVLQISLYDYGDGTTITAANADDLFADAAFHEGFSATGGDMKIDVIPAPAAVLLGLMGLGLVGWRMRKYA